MEISKDEILNKIGSYDIFNRYLNSIVGKELKAGEVIKSPLRHEVHPSFNIYLPAGADPRTGWRFKDFGGDGGDCFQFIMCYYKVSFKDALQMIVSEFKLDMNGVHRREEQIAVAGQNIDVIKGDGYEVTVKDFTPPELTYWSEYGITSDILKKFNVASVRRFTANSRSGKLYTVEATESSFIFAYLQSGWIKIYRPQQKKFRFLHLGTKPEKFIFGLDKLLTTGEVLFITGGEKDVMTLTSRRHNAISLNSETSGLGSVIAADLKNRFKQIYVLYDNDSTGLKMSEKISKEHNFSRLVLPAMNDGKDISDYFKNHSTSDFERLINESGIPREETKLVSHLSKIEDFINKHFEIRFNVVTCKYECRRSGDETFSQLNENNIYRALLQNHLNVSITKLKALLGSDFVKHYHPLLDYFESLQPWNEETDADHIDQLCNYIPVSVEDRIRLSVQLKKWLIRVVGCALDENIVNKQALTFVQEEQNTGKSTLCRWLCPQSLKEYFTENISTDKDSHICLATCMLINFDELSTNSRMELNALKSLFSKDRINVRLPYDARTSVHLRRASFLGSTNKVEFLTDETGSVRWLCFKLTGKINFDYKKDLNPDDIWRQAFSMYKSGFSFEMTVEEIAENESANRQFVERSIEMELLQKHYTPGEKEKGDAFLTATDLCLEFSKYPSYRSNIRMMGKALKQLGFSQESRYNDELGYSIKGYYVSSVGS